MKLNNHGQTLIIVIILLPLIILFVAYVIDFSLVTYEKNRSYQTSKVIINDYFEHNLDNEEINKLFKENKILVKKITINENELIVDIEYSIVAIFGNIIGIKEYKIKLNLKGIKKEEKVLFIRG